MNNLTSTNEEAVPRRTAGLYRNLISLVGAAIAIASLVGVIFLFLADILSSKGNPYLGIFAYVLFPAIMIFGLLLFFAGMIVERRRRHKLAPSQVRLYPRIDLNSPRQRRMISLFVVFTFLFIFASSVGSYQAYHYSESTAFCGVLCHTVMNPEYTAYQHSPHARVACVECHVGPGAGWYLRSKLTGAYQVYSILFHKYPRPIRTPVHSLRPAQETCEQCHWPEKFFGTQLKVFNHFSEDENNTPRQIRMLINTGGGSERSGFVMGIHWHMNLANEVTYISTDDQRQVIPWMRFKNKTGEVTEYLAKDSTLTPEQIAQMPKRRMDCVDCHNRPTHIYTPPTRSVDDALLAGKIDRGLPYVRQQAVQALTKTYNTTDEARRAIATDLENYYRTNYAERYAGLGGSIKGAIAEVQRIYSTTIFPEMKVDWRTHPDNLSHYYFPGCFRCHDGQHESKDGKVVRNDCNTCHTVLEQTEGSAPIMPIQGKAFQHPIDLGDMKGMKCIDCHSAVASNK